ncbi:glycoside hydrolase superfamily [Mycena vitilis]|nr:glycoside hydrolase superfamily [Mycena vitilis]
MRFAPTAGVGIVHDCSSTSTNHASKSHSCRPASASTVSAPSGRACSRSRSGLPRPSTRTSRTLSEARSIGIHACFSPVLDLGKEPRWGRVQEAWGEDFVLTSHMGVAYASGLSKNGSWAEPDAVVPVMKHFAAHGSARGGLNAAPFMGRGSRQVLMEMLVPFKAVFDLGGAKGVMMAYNELDEVPAVVNPMLYDALADWNYDGFIIADDTAMQNLITRHFVANSDADAIQQWFNAGGGVQFYDFPLEIFLNTTVELVTNRTIPKSTLQAAARRVLSTKYDLGASSTTRTSPTPSTRRP